MKRDLIFIYDGQCPFCNHFAELIELKSNFSGLLIKDARDKPSEIPDGYDMDVKGALLLKDGEILNGADAINWICSQIENPSGSLLNILTIVFQSKQRSNFLFPFLIVARRATLFCKGVPRKIF